jgi:hypothetical protein
MTATQTMALLTDFKPFIGWELQCIGNKKDTLFWKKMQATIFNNGERASSKEQMQCTRGRDGVLLVNKGILVNKNKVQ